MVSCYSSFNTFTHNFPAIVESISKAQVEFCPLFSHILKPSISPLSASRPFSAVTQWDYLRLNQIASDLHQWHFAKLSHAILYKMIPKTSLQNFSISSNNYKIRISIFLYALLCLSLWVFFWAAVIFYARIILQNRGWNSKVNIYSFTIKLSRQTKALIQKIL